LYRGYIKTWRKVADAGWLKNHKLWAFWSWCLIKASHKDIDQIVGMQTISLSPGQLIFGRKRAAIELNMSEQEIRTVLDYLVKSKNLTIKSTNKFSIITIVNWDTYQSDGDYINQQSNMPLTNKQPATNQQLTTNKNDKNVKNDKNKEYSPDFLSFWNAYPKKSGSKKAAFDNWNKLNGDKPKIETILAAIKDQIEWRENARDGDFRPEWKDPERWIKGKMWEAELTTQEIDLKAWAKKRQAELDAEDYDA